MKLAIGLIVMTEFALAQGPHPARVRATRLRPCVRMPLLPRGALLPPFSQQHLKTSRRWPNSQRSLPGNREPAMAITPSGQTTRQHQNKPNVPVFPRAKLSSLS